MTIPVSIDTLLQGQVVESTRIEFKSDLNPSPVTRTICAFANDIDNIGGGYIILGVEEINGRPQLPPRGIPAERIDGILKKLLNYCNLIEPRYIPAAEPVVYEGRNLIVIWARAGTGRPYRAPEDVTNRNSHKYCYIRKLSSTIKAKDHELRELYSVSETIPYDDQMNPYAGVEDLNPLLIQSFLQETRSALAERAASMPVEQLALDMQLLQGPPEDLHPVNAALLFFSDHPERFFRYAYIDTVYIPDPTGENMIEKRFSGPVHLQLRQTLNWLQSTILEEKVRKVRGVPEAFRIKNYPFEAIEEILANAVYHKSYQIPEPVTVRVTTNSIEITSHPGFNSSIRDEDIQKYDIRSRIYRNRRIGDFLKELRLIEGRNTGFPTALKALKNNGSHPLRFEYDPQRQYLSVIIPVHPMFLQVDSQTEKKNEYNASIKRIVSESPVSLTQLAIRMGYRGITRKLSAAVNQMVETGELCFIIGEDGRKKIAEK